MDRISTSATSAPSVSVAALQLLLAGLLAAIPILMATTDYWREIYAVGVATTTAFATILCLGRLTGRGLLEMGGLLLLVLVPPILSLVVNPPEDFSPLANLAVMACYGIIGLAVMGRPDAASYRFFLVALALAQGVAVIVLLFLTANTDSLVVVLADQRAAFDFEDFNLHPNYIGLMCVVIACCAASLPGIWSRVLVIGIAASLSWLVSSRAATLAIMAALAVMHLMPYVANAQFRSRLRPGTILWAAGGLVLVTLLFGRSVIGFLGDKVLLLDDDYRGADTGFTSRTELWELAFDLWRENPIFGVGYGMGSEMMGAGLYAHNLELVLLSETGLVGMLGFFFFSLLAFRNGLRALRAGYVSAGTSLLTLIAVYWIYGLFEGRAINAGNPLSAYLFLMCFASAGFPANEERPAPSGAAQSALSPP